MFVCAEYVNAQEIPTDMRSITDRAAQTLLWTELFRGQLNTTMQNNRGKLKASSSGSPLLASKTGLTYRSGKTVAEGLLQLLNLNFLSTSNSPNIHSNKDC